MLQGAFPNHLLVPILSQPGESSLQARPLAGMHGFGAILTLTIRGRPGILQQEHLLDMTNLLSTC